MDSKPYMVREVCLLALSLFRGKQDTVKLILKQIIHLYKIKLKLYLKRVTESPRIICPDVELTRPVCKKLKQKKKYLMSGRQGHR